MDHQPLISSPILAQLPHAQESYITTIKGWADINIDDTLFRANQSIADSIGRGWLVAYLTDIDDVKVAEKTCLALESIGYHCVTTNGGSKKMDDGSYKPLSAISIDWKYMPANIRDEYSA